MASGFEELDWRPTAIGALSLRRRTSVASGAEVYEIKLGDDFLMSSQFTAAEIALGTLGLAAATGPGLDVVVGGLGLGYTADAVLDDPRVRSLVVVEALGAVIDWHAQGLLPLGARLTGDPRCRLVEGDFFAILDTPGRGFDPDEAARRFHAVLLDIDHSPRDVLAPANAAFYEPAGLKRLTATLHPGGVFGLWSNAPPDAAFMAVMEEVFATVRSHVVRFANPLQDREATNTVYVGTT